jgi:hypothetical protein
VFAQGNANAALTTIASVSIHLDMSLLRKGAGPCAGQKYAVR